MIGWINGAFGSGKTQTTYELQRRLERAFVFDPETVGYYIRRNVPASMVKADFQDHTVWRETLLRRLRSRGDGARSWAAEQIDRCTAGLAGEAFRHHLDTERLALDEQVEAAAALLGMKLRPDNRGAVGKFAGRLATKLRHIRL